MTKREEVIQRTKQDVLSILDREGYCSLVRPTGFGKTKLFADIYNSGRYPVIFFLYPRDIIGESVKERIADCGVTVYFLSYQSLYFLSVIGENFRKKFTDSDFGLVFADESHFLGAEKWGQGFRYLEETYPKWHFLGATATPIRTDKVDISERFFKGITPFSYTMDDAIVDGIYPKPLYVLSPYNVQAEALSFYKDEEENGVYANQEIKATHLKLLEKNIMDFVNSSSVISLVRTYFYPLYKKDNYLKIMVFFPTYTRMYSENGIKLVSEWFTEVFREGNVRQTIIANDSIEHKDLSQLDALSNDNNGTVDLIYSIDKLTYGYHSDDISGIVMIRYTDSDIVLGQQVGRAFSINNPNQAIIFDLVGNLRRLKSNTHYEIEKVVPAGTRNSKTLKENKNGNSLLSMESVDLVDMQANFNDLILGMDSRRLHRKQGVYELLLKGIMPPWIACKELYLSTPEQLVALLKMDSMYEVFCKAIKGKFDNWEEKVQ